ncbi:MAG: hypothetical protein HYX75_21255 [Acidobacteria bacterium]|nr:hypothetical protein [Acidobacteriota bacterium]
MRAVFSNGPAPLRMLGIIAALLSVVSSQGQADSWTVVKGPNTGSLNVQLTDVVSLSPKDAWAVGNSWASDGSKSASFVIRYDGKKWKTVSVPGVSGRTTSLRGICALAADDIWVVGSSRDSTTGGHTLTMHWNGSKWTIVNSPGPSSAYDVLLQTVVGVAPNDVWAFGMWDSWDPTKRYKTLILHWNGSAWSTVTSPNPTQGDNYLLGATALSSTSIIAVGGAFSYDGKSVATEVLRWDGKSWKTTSGPSSHPGQSDLVLLPMASTGSFLTSALLYESTSGVKSFFVGGLSYTRTNALASVAKATASAPKWSAVSCPAVSEHGSFMDGFARDAGDTRVVGIGAKYTQSGYLSIAEVFTPSGSKWNATVSLDELPGTTANNLLSAISAWPNAADSRVAKTPTFWAVGHTKDSKGKYGALILKATLSD